MNTIVLKKIIAVLAVSCMVCSMSGCSSHAAGEQAITEEQALSAIQNYCYEENPELENETASDDTTIYWDVSTNDTGEIVVLFRSYTGSETRYYIDPVSGETYSTELVPGIIDEEQRTDESFNAKAYLK